MLNACRAPADNAVYKPRNPRHSHYYRCIEAHFEELEGAWEERYQRTCGFWRPLVMDVIYKYLDCGDLHFGFARVRCDTCGHEYLLAFSCKRRHFCPSCHQKRVVEFGEWLYGEVLKQVPHRQWVFSIPKRLRIYFMFDRRLLAKLSQCAWTVLSGYLKQGAAFDDAVPGAVIAVQTFGDFQNFNPHLHIIATDGCFYGNGGFAAGPRPNPSDLETAFRLEVLKMLKNEGKITGLIIENMLSWHHSGFNAYCGEAIWPSDQEGIERLAQYIIRVPIAQERMAYIPAAQTRDGVAKVVYTAKDGKTSRTFAALDWLAQLVRYYGYYSNKSRGLRKKSAAGDQMPALVESGISRTEFRKNWARLIQKVYHADPLLCPKCNGSMRIVSFIESPETIKKILLHLNLWETRNHDPPDFNAVKHIPEAIPELSCDDYS
ncbi:MAG: transposase [Desulforudis sp.]|nr:MAG: transposase [Desulforudis sp.]